MAKFLDVMASITFLLSLLGFLSVFLFYPFVLWMRGVLGPRRPVAKGDDHLPSVTIVSVVHNAEDVIESKIRNCLSVDYPRDRLEIILASDGSTDRTVPIIRAFQSETLKLIENTDHEGKYQALNSAALQAKGDILVFSDGDALLDESALKRLVPPFADPAVGGVCGQRVLATDDGKLRSAQKNYVEFDSLIKRLETKIGNITSNDGKLYGVRRELFRPIAPAATDDLYECLEVVAQGYRFVFEPAAVAYICTPSKTPSHEVLRRRRIVSRSLCGIWMMCCVLTRAGFRGYALGLFVNKVVRRLLPLILLLLLLSSWRLAGESAWFTAFFAVQLGAYGLAVLHPILDRIRPRRRWAKRVRKAASVAFYFCIGCYGTFLGLMDFLLGRRVTKWCPEKAQLRGGGDQTAA